MHTLFIYNYLHICKSQTIPFLDVLPIAAPRDRPLAQQGSRVCWTLVDPCQLLYNLNHLVHRSFTLHAAAVIDL